MMSKYRSLRANRSEGEEPETGLVNTGDEIVFGQRGSFREAAVSAQERCINIFACFSEKSSIPASTFISIRKLHCFSA